MQFVYPAKFEHTAQGDVVVSFRDLPECLTSGSDEADAFTEASDALEEAIAGRIADGDPIPTPSAARAGENEVPVPAGMAAKAALVVALRKSGRTRHELAKLLGLHEQSVRQMLDPRYATAADRINAALRVLGSQIVIGTRVA